MSKSLLEKALREASPDPSVLKKLNRAISDEEGAYHKATQDIMRIQDAEVARETNKLMLTMLTQQQADLKKWIQETERGLAKMK